ncbi:hypothetical protein XFPR_09475 [Xylella fastidiosa]|uniref:Uncharacterized protein n=2 Tax=Xylella fastidiosa TaxID=2371 RepID=A0ABC8AFA0_XYLFS|nr:hypothetical protein [Xylella fastidiosa]ALQ94477.1 hypothetical protein XFUD_04170 [Xylella fastidiosa]ALQ97592.1 hypothetical protein XFC3_09655 [Xylella fastidiosa]ALR01959.1 hypothetical protein OY18_06635 [Xylella fastidiosa]ALR04815.1 hypothetical protein XFPR_09475 [Xylella fastidiosa]ALR07221.1 hypothetical protein XFHB_10550 [Xylella fastidiosa]
MMWHLAHFQVSTLNHHDSGTGGVPLLFSIILRNDMTATGHIVQSAHPIQTMMQPTALTHAVHTTTATIHNHCLENIIALAGGAGTGHSSTNRKIKTIPNSPTLERTQRTPHTATMPPLTTAA